MNAEKFRNIPFTVEILIIIHIRNIVIQTRNFVKLDYILFLLSLKTQIGIDNVHIYDTKINDI